MFKKAILFILIGIPGLFIFLFSSFGLVFYVARYGSLFEIVLFAVLIPVGSILILIGTGKFKQWLYISVFLSFPCVISLVDIIRKLLHIPSTTKSCEGLPVSVFVSVLIYILLNYYYQRSDYKLKESIEVPVKKTGIGRRAAPFLVFSLFQLYIGIIIFLGFNRYILFRRNSLTEQFLRDASRSQEAYYLHNRTYADSIEKLAGIYDFQANKEIVEEIKYADTSQYEMTAKHRKGGKKFVIIGPGGDVQPYLALMRKRGRLANHLLTTANDSNRCGNYKKAIDLYTEFINGLPSTAKEIHLSRVYQDRGECYLKIKDCEKALEDALMAIELDPSNAHRWFFHSKIIRDMGHVDQAIVDLDKCIELSPNASYWYSHRGDLWLEIGDVKRAQADYKKSLELGNDESVKEKLKKLTKLII